MKTVNKIVDHGVRAVMAISGIVLLTVTFLQVVCRYMLKIPLPWSQDIIRLSFTYLVFWGAAYCVRDKAHLNVDVVLTSLPDRVRRMAEIAINLLLIGFFCFLFFMGLQFAKTGATQTTSYLPVSMSWYYMSIPSAAVLMVFYMVQIVAEQIRNLSGRREN